MSDTTLDSRGAATGAPASSDLYRAVWRWHFYAGLLVLPFLILLAVTGALYLFRDEIDGLVHADLQRVEARAAADLTPTALVAAALAQHPGTALKYLPPASPTASAEVGIKTPAGEKVSVFVDPHDGRVLGTLPDKGTVMWTIRTIHSLNYFGPVAAGAIEIAAGWAILLVATGVYLWWPRRQNGGVVSVRGTPKRRVFWRDLHAVTGIFVGFFIVFLALTGMPWSGVWGAKVNEWANSSNHGYPRGVRVAVPMSDEHLPHMGPTTWSLEQARVPMSSAGAAPIGLDEAVAIFERLGLHSGYTVNLPSGPNGVYTGSVYPDDLAQQRVVHLDQYTGKPLVDMSYGDYGVAGKGLEWGVNVHLGQQYGLANQLVLLAACLGIVVLAVSAAVMWWKRRPFGSLGVPPMPSDRRVFRGVITILAVGGIIFPLVGASLVVMLGLDVLFTWSLRPRTA
jgi:uncharacterized iron-regulated membrane protein